jgi:hypothetical protein
MCSIVSLERVDVWIRVNADIFQGGLEGGETLAFQQGADSRPAVRGAVDAVLHPDLLQIPDQVNPLLQGGILLQRHP